MPHKINPINFEKSEGNFGLSNSIMKHMSNKLPISRWQRDLSDSTVMRCLGTALSHMLIACKSIIKGIDGIEINSKKMIEDLNKNPEILGEGFQTILRKYKYKDPYEMIVRLTKGKTFNTKEQKKFIGELNVDSNVKKELFSLNVTNYLGISNKFNNDFFDSK